MLACPYTKYVPLKNIENAILDLKIILLDHVRFSIWTTGFQVLVLYSATRGWCLSTNSRNGATFHPLAYLELNPQISIPVDV